MLNNISKLNSNKLLLYYYEISYLVYGQNLNYTQMKRILLFSLILCCTIGNSYSQLNKNKIERYNNSSQNLNNQQELYNKQNSTQSGVKRKLEKNIFNDLIFSDSNNNKITYKSDFIKKVLKISANDTEFKQSLFSSLTYFLNDKKNYQETFDVNIFDQVIISSNTGDKIQIDLDMVSDEDRFLWTNKYKIINNQSVDTPKFNIKRDAFGNLSFKDYNTWARIVINNYGEAEYQDSYKNTVRFNSRAWKKAVRNAGGDDVFFEYLLELYIEY